MDSLTQAATVLRRAEADLRRLLSQAAASGDYGSVVQVTTWARSISDLLRQAPQEPLTSTPHGASANPMQLQRPQHATRPSTSTYPRFFRQGERLVRVAWSKRERKEYEHKLSVAALKALIASIATRGADGRVFSMDDLLPIRDPEGIEVPTYQAYAGLALLKHVGLVEQHGRQGYSTTRPTAIGSAVDAVLRNLPERPL